LFQVFEVPQDYPIGYSRTYPCSQSKTESSRSWP
jgi:hypothetical protein